MLLLLIVLYFNFINSYHLTNNQYSSIMNLIKNNDLTKIQRNKLNDILYKSHEEYSIKRSLVFKKKHYSNCNKISNNEMILYGKMGLYKSVLKYDGRSNFTYFAALNIHYEHLNALNDAHSLSILPVSIRKKNKKKFTQDEMNEYKKLLNVELKYDTSFWRNNMNINNDNQYNLYKYEKLWSYIHTLDPILKEIIYLKFDNNFNIIRKHKDIAEIKSLSTETIRKRLNKFKQEMKKYFLDKENLNI